MNAFISNLPTFFKFKSNLKRNKIDAPQIYQWPREHPNYMH